MNKLCKTNPISDMPKILVSLVKTMTNNKKQPTFRCQKQSQNKAKQTQPVVSKPVLSIVERVEPFALRFLNLSRYFRDWEELKINKTSQSPEPQRVRGVKKRHFGGGEINSRIKKKSVDVGRVKIELIRLFDR